MNFLFSSKELMDSLEKNVGENTFCGNEVQSKLNQFFVDCEEKSQVKTINREPNFTKIFKLPITYLENIHSILPTTATDLELIKIHSSQQDIENGSSPILRSEESINFGSGDASAKNVNLPSQDTVNWSSSTLRSEESLNSVKKRKSMYEYLFRPSNEFSKQLLPEWGKYFTSNVEYLIDTQKVILNMNYFNFASTSFPQNSFSPTLRSGENVNNFSTLHFFSQDTKNRASPTLCPEKSLNPEVKRSKISNIINIWNCLKHDDFFLDKYGYMDWSMLLHLNQSSSFLQWLTIVNLMSPITSLLIPIILIIFPFLLLKIQQVPIDFTTYVKVLGEIAQNHFIGKIINIENISYDKIIYIIFSTGMYFLQIYQNINFCFSFYKNIKQINKQLYEIREYVSTTVENMKLFIKHNNYKTYSPFIKRLNIALGSLVKLEYDLSFFNKENFNPILNAHEMGYILKMYYELYSNTEYEDALLYSFGFEGYLENLSSIWNYYKNDKIKMSSFLDEKDLPSHFSPKTTENGSSSTPRPEKSINSLTIKEQFYIPYIESECVKNDCNLKDNMIISGVNASGKTTYLKTTTLNVLFSQQIGFGCFQSMYFIPYTQIHSYLNIPDTSDRDSLFQAEARRCKDIIDMINNGNTLYSEKIILPTPATENGVSSTICSDKFIKRERHFCIFDELYSGTNPLEASKSAYAFLLYLSKYNNVNYMITTHYKIICKKLEKKTKVRINGIQRRIRCFQTDVVQNEDGSLKYKYKIKPGICRIQGAIEVLKNMNYPKDIIEKYLHF